MMTDDADADMKMKIRSLPSNQILRLATKVYIIMESKVIPPVHNLFVRFMWSFGTEWGVSNKAFKHDCT